MATDFTYDKNPKPLYRALEAGLIPDWMSDIEIPNRDDVSGLHKVAFADRDNELHPIDCPANTILSAAYIFGNKTKNEERIISHLKEAASIHGVEDDVEKIESYYNNSIKQASAPKEEYALSIDMGGEQKNFYPINNYAQVTDSALQLHKDAHEKKLPPEWVWVASQELVKRAEDLSVDEYQIPKDIWELGQDRMPDLGYAMTIAEMRKGAGASEEATKICIDLVKAAAVDGADIPELLRLWSDVDRMENIKYSAAVPDPYRAFYSGDHVSDLEKAAAERVFIGDVMVPKDEFHKVSHEKLEQRFREDVANAIKSAAEIAETAPEHASAILEELDSSHKKELLSILLG